MNSEKNIKHANDLDAETTAQLNAFKDQLIIVLVKRLGGNLDIPVAEMDDTGQDLLFMEVDTVKGFHFEVGKKS